MPNIEINLNQRLQGLLFYTRYIINCEANKDAVQSAIEPVLAARAAIQTPDVEYLDASYRELDNPAGISGFLQLEYQRGAFDGHTAPPANFLNMQFGKLVGRPANHRVRGYPITELTENGIFNLNSTGDADPSEADTGTTGTTDPISSFGSNLVAYGTTVVANCLDSIGRHAFSGYSSRVSTGSKPIRRSV